MFCPYRKPGAFDFGRLMTWNIPVIRRNHPDFNPYSFPLESRLAQYNTKRIRVKTGDLPAEPVSQDHLYEQVIGAVGDAHAHAEIELPFRVQIQIDGGYKLLLLVA